MANKREITKRRRTVGNIHKITRTMEMIATGRFKKAHNAAVAAKPFAQKIFDLAGIMARCDGGDIDHPLLRENPAVRRWVVLVIAGNRGLCGGYNANIIHLANQQLQELRQAGFGIDLRVAGKKAIQHFKYARQPIDAGYTDFDEKTTYQTVALLANEFMNLYRRQEIAGVKVLYTGFHSAARFHPEVLNLLPIYKPAAAAAPPHRPKKTEYYLFSPSAAAILAYLIPMSVRINLFQCFRDSLLSEQAARMRAMQAATDSAEQMIKNLSRQYNRLRQTQITSELLDIIGGAQAI